MSFDRLMVTSRQSESPHRTYTNPVYAGYFADPFVFQHEGVYYAVGTGAAPNGDREFPTLRSEDLVNWEPLEAALIRPDVDGNAYWAPEVAFSEGRFYMYYSVGTGDKNHHLRVAVSNHPQGPYEDTGTPLLDPETAPFAIDASPFQDDDGRWYLFYARDFLDTDRPGTSLVVAPLIEMTKAAPEYTVVMRAHHDWQRYQENRPIYGGAYDWHTLEGPCTLKHDGRYYCIYSGGNWQNDSYGLDFVSADSISGPYTDSNPGDGPRLLRTLPGKVLGPGHNSVVTGPDGSRQFVCYHAWDRSIGARRLCIDKLTWTEDGPRCAGPTWEPQPLDDGT